MIIAARSVLRAVLVVLPAVAVIAVAAPAGAATIKVCLPVRATAAGQILPPNDQGQIQTTATVSVAGQPVATTNATFTPSGPPDDTLSFTGPIVFTSDLNPATLTANVQGSVHLKTGKFSAASTSVSGTGLLSTVSGHLRFHGTDDPSGVSFTEAISGRLCVRVG
jgi:hypothetical protein